MTRHKLTEIPVRWVIFENDERIGEGTTVAASVVLNRLADAYARKGQRFMWERTR